MKEFKTYIRSLFMKQTSLDLIASESLDARKAFILSEKNRIYQESMSNYLSRYMQFLEDFHE